VESPFFYSRKHSTNGDHYPVDRCNIENRWFSKGFYKMKQDNFNLQHLSFEEYFQNDWRKHFQDEETIKSIMDATGFSSSHDFVQINSRYLIDDNRLAVIALIKRKTSRVLEKMIIDVIAGNSSFEQLYDVVYNTGSGCDYRLMICDWHSKNKSSGLWMTDHIMHQLINHLDLYLSLYWICADAIRDVDGSKKITYTVMESVSRSGPSFDVPPRRDLEYAELMLYTLQASGNFSSRDEINLQIRNYYEDDFSWAEWQDECLITEVSIEEDEYQWILANMRDEIVDENCSYTYDEGVLTIREEIPFQNFCYSLPAVKSDLAEKFYWRARIRLQIDEYLSEMHAEESHENSVPEANEDKILSQKTVSPISCNEWLHKEPPIYPTVQAFLGRNWKKYFQKSKIVKKIVEAVDRQDHLKAIYGRRQNNDIVPINYDCPSYDFIKLNSVIQLGPERLRIIATFLEIESGLFEKWSMDISPSLTLDQILYAMYDSEDGCTKKIILRFKNFHETDDSDPEIRIEKRAAENVLCRVPEYSDYIYIINVTITDSSDEKSKLEISFFPNVSFGREKVPARSAFESEFWDVYYHAYINEYTSKIKEMHHTRLITDTGHGLPYDKIPFFVWPEWTDKGLCLNLDANHDCPETNWLLKCKMDDLAKRYDGFHFQRVIKPYTHYSVVIHLHDSPVSDFVESSALAKFNYASDIRKQQMDMIRHIEEIFQDYVSEEKLS